MLSWPPPLRLWTTAGLLLGAYVLLHTTSHGEPVIPHRPIRDLPYTVGNWKGQDLPVPEQIVQASGLSDYTNRVYFGPAETPIQLYIAYYASQRAGDTMHSPKNCLPGAGWEPISTGYARISPATSREM